MKLLAMLVLAMLLVLGGIALVVRLSAPVVPCDERVVLEAPQPIGENVAAVVQRTCDGVISMHVGLRRAGKPLAAQGEVFAAAGPSPVSVEWRDGALLIESPARQVLREETQWRDVPVRVRVAR